MAANQDTMAGDLVPEGRVAPLQFSMAFPVHLAGSHTAQQASSQLWCSARLLAQWSLSDLSKYQLEFNLNKSGGSQSTDPIGRGKRNNRTTCSGTSIVK